MYDLLIAEKPSAAKKIAELLADGKPKKQTDKKVSYYEFLHEGKPLVVASGVGHLFGLHQKEKGWSYPVFDIEWAPIYETSKDAAFSKPYAMLIKKLAKSARNFVVCTDYDVEGSVIGWNIIRFLCKKDDASRMQFSTLTKEDVVSAFNDRSKTLDWGQCFAGETRHKLDWFYGINLSRALTDSIKAAKSFKVMSIGRVQGPALKLIVDLEKEIQAFKPEPYWQLQVLTKDFEAWHKLKINAKKVEKLVGDLLSLIASSGVKLDFSSVKQMKESDEVLKQAKAMISQESSILKSLEGVKKDSFVSGLDKLRKEIDVSKFWDEQEAIAIFNKVKSEKKATVVEVKKRSFKQAPPHPFDLTTLQTESYAHFGIVPKETLSYAQSLYSSGFISYPRTSSQQLSSKLGLKKVLQHLAKQPAYKKLADIVLAFPKLVPNNGKKTDPAHPAIYPTGVVPKGLKEREKKVYDLVVRRFLATFGESAKREAMDVLLDVKQEIFVAKGKRTVEPNWHLLYAPYVKLEEVELPELSKGGVVLVRKVNKLDKQTSPPKRFTQSSIIRELEKRNLGTKATRAEIVDTLYRRGYVDGKSLEATRFGVETVTVLEKYVPEILDEELTRHFDEDMDKVFHGQEEEETVLSEAQKHLVKLLKKFKSKEKEIGEELLGAVREAQDIASTLGTCPVCKKGSLKMLYSKKTKKKFIGCDRYPSCETALPLPQNALLKHTEKVCEECGFPLLLVIRKGKRPQESCVNPDCKSKQSKLEGVGTKCPNCGVGIMVERHGFYGPFVACDQYPKCKTILSTKKFPKKKAVKKVVKKTKKVSKKNASKKKARK